MQIPFLAAALAASATAEEYIVSRNFEANQNTWCSSGGNFLQIYEEAEGVAWAVFKGGPASDAVAYLNGTQTDYDTTGAWLNFPKPNVEIPYNLKLPIDVKEGDKPKPVPAYPGYTEKQWKLVPKTDKRTDLELASHGGSKTNVLFVCPVTYKSGETLPTLFFGDRQWRGVDGCDGVAWFDTGYLD